MPFEINNVKIHHTGHSGFLIESNNANIYIDPYQLNKLSTEELKYIESHKATHIVCTHDHFDHLSMEDIEKVSCDKTIYLAPKSCEALKKFSTFIELNVDHSIINVNIKFEGVHAYNTNKNFHKKEFGYIGVIININGVRIYHAGDTDVIGEMKTFKNLDVALLPVSGTYVMTTEEAINAANMIESKNYIPMHYGAIIGDKTMAEIFISKIPNSILPSF